MPKDKTKFKHQDKFWFVYDECSKLGDDFAKVKQTVDKNNQVFTLNSSNSRRYLFVEYKKNKNNKKKKKKKEEKEKKATFYSNHVPSGPSCAFRGTFVLCLQENEKTLAA